LHYILFLILFFTTFIECFLLFFDNMIFHNKTLPAIFLLFISFFGLNAQNSDEATLIYYNRQLMLYKELGDAEGEAEALDNLAYTNSQKGNIKAANELYRQAYEIKMKNDDKDGAGFSMSNVGQTYWTLGEYNKAIQSHNEAIELRKQANNRKGQAYSLAKLGDLYNESGDPNKALEAFNLAVNLYEEIGDIKGPCRYL